MFGSVHEQSVGETASRRVIATYERKTVVVLPERDHRGIEADEEVDQRGTGELPSASGEESGGVHPIQAQRELGGGAEVFPELYGALKSLGHEHHPGNGGQQALPLRTNRRHPNPHRGHHQPPLQRQLGGNRPHSSLPGQRPHQQGLSHSSSRLRKTIRHLHRHRLSQLQRPQQPLRSNSPLGHQCYHHHS